MKEKNHSESGNFLCLWNSSKTHPRLEQHLNYIFLCVCQRMRNNKFVFIGNINPTQSLEKISPKIGLDSHISNFPLFYFQELLQYLDFFWQKLFHAIFFKK